MRILHLSDTHLFADPSALHYDRIDTTGALQRLLERLAPVRDIDVIVHSGDASEDGSAESYQALHQMLEPFAQERGAALAIAMGNHDVSATYGEAIEPGQHLPESQDRVLELGTGHRVIVLDSSVPGAGHGELDPAQLQWLRGVLAEPAQAGSVLVIHHPPLAAATRLLQGLELHRREELGEILRDSDVRVVLSGHYHHEMNGEIAGIPVHVVPGVTNTVDPVTAGETERALAFSGVSIVEIDDSSASETPERAQPAVRVITSVFPNGGDTRGDSEQPVYEFGPEEIELILHAATR